MYEEIFESIRKAAEKRNLRERTIQLYCSDVGYFLRCTNKSVDDLTLEDADAFLTMKRLEGRSPKTHNHYRSSIKFLYQRVLKIAWDDEEVPAMKRERNLPTVLTQKEINAIIDVTDNLKHKAIIATMYSSGLRVSEVLLLLHHGVEAPDRVVLQSRHGTAPVKDEYDFCKISVHNKNPPFKFVNWSVSNSEGDLVNWP